MAGASAEMQRILMTMMNVDREIASPFFENPSAMTNGDLESAVRFFESAIRALENHDAIAGIGPIPVNPRSLASTRVPSSSSLLSEEAGSTVTEEQEQQEQDEQEELEYEQE
uniref:Uncharacterized protein n=1 Tax=Alexandrium andersonii TaxID=327968 RepID=A0A7S2DL89_9DINO|mmetsp:Transcript_55875/g.125933  ORF Transcript_55875/g.125933 Transcript_55875/m.125933 type:complete len:112 (+) Transcript_55875:102-437(+)